MSASPSFVVDCQTVLRGMTVPKAALFGKSLCSRYWGDVAHHTDAGNLKIAKVKAHRSVEEATDELDRIRILGNRFADRMANEGAQARDLFKDVEDELIHSLEAYQSILEGAGRMPLAYCTSMGSGTMLSVPCNASRLPTSEFGKLWKGEVPGTQLKFGNVALIAF
mmetsp:Transcript_20072/g.53820  ORF Transcript_20072/g.53820 Transcript_20072/m.53820 type:complete len:166 (+) Transcript_20072:63-560(+)